MHPYIQRESSTFSSCELAAFPANVQLQGQPAQQNGHKPHRAAGDGWEVRAHRDLLPPLAPKAWVPMRELSHTHPHAWDPHVRLQMPYVHGQPSGRLVFPDSLGPEHEASSPRMESPGARWSQLLRLAPHAVYQLFSITPAPDLVPAEQLHNKGHPRPSCPKEMQVPSI